MKKLLFLILILTIILLSGILTSCKRNELPSELTQNNTSSSAAYLDEYVVPTEYTKPYMTTRHGSYTLYKKSFYYCSTDDYIEYIQLSDPIADLRVSGSKNGSAPQIHSICNDPLCNHNVASCMANTESRDSQFLIDEVESAGGNPVFYYFTAVSDTTVSGSEIYHVDSGAGTKEKLATVKEPIIKMAAFKEHIYFITQSSEDLYELNMVSKAGGDVVTLSLGKCMLNLLGGNADRLYLNDENGNVYAVDYALESSEKIYTVKEFYPDMTGYRAADLGMFIDAEYLYFYADFKVETFSWYTTDTIDFINHSIRRVRLDSPEGDGELVTESVFERAVYGIYDGVLYYGPFEVITDDPAFIYPVAHSNGIIRGVDLTTLETRDVVSECGANFERSVFFVSNKCIIGITHPYLAEIGIEPTSSGAMVVLYEFATGAFYRLCANAG